jgi:hypothetical protein
MLSIAYRRTGSVDSSRPLNPGSIDDMTTDSDTVGPGRPGVAGPCDRVSAWFRGLDRRLHIDHGGRSEWIWAVPVLSFLGTLGLFVLQGAVISATSPALYIPLGLVLAAVMAGMSVAYMTPEPEAVDEGRDGGSEFAGRRPPEPLDDWSRWMRDRPETLPEEPWVADGSGRAAPHR